MAPTVWEFVKEQTSFGPDLIFLREKLDVWRACENRKKRVSHGESVRVGNSGRKQLQLRCCSVLFSNIFGALNRTKHWSEYTNHLYFELTLAVVLCVTDRC